MTPTPQETDAERRELRSLVERIKRGACVLVLGPRVAMRPDDPERQPLDELLARDLLSRTDPPESTPPDQPVSLRRAADSYLRQVQDRVDLELAVGDFYAGVADTTTDFHRDLAQLPFTLCLSASPDSQMLVALQKAGKSPQRGHYSFKQTSSARLASPSADKPLVYGLFGHHEEPTSLVLTEGDLIEYLVSIVRGTPPVPDQVRSLLADPAASFLFLGFGFHNWYLRVLLQVLNIYGHRSNAFEDTPFFNHPEHQETAGFFSGDRLVNFRPLHWEGFAVQLREAYLAGAPRKTADAAALKGEPPGANAPKAFVSYASEDRPAVEALAEALESRGIRIWQDKQDLRAGDDWDRVLLDVIAKRVDYVIVVQTPMMVSRTEGVFYREITAAARRQGEMGEFEGQRLRFLIAVTLGDCKPLATLSAGHVIDVGPEEGVAALAASILEDWDRRKALLARRLEAA